MAGRKDAYGKIYDALDSTGIDWHKVNGSKHVKVYLGGHLIGILPHGKTQAGGAGERRVKNFVKRIERAVPEIKAGTYSARGE